VLDIQVEAYHGAYRLRLECIFAARWSVVFGPSGAGKSTLLRIIAGLDRDCLRSGRIVLRDRVLTDTAGKIFTRPGARRIALVTQQPALFPHLSVEANVAYGIANLPRAAQAEQVNKMLELAGAAHLAGRRPQSLSGGEAQRVALARALATNPRLLLLDEPFSALDGAAADALLDRLQPWLNAEGIQTIQATHDATNAFFTGAEVALLRDGSLVGQGPAGEVLAAERVRLARHLESV
jgi:ABC-type sulfate/molybdate transport systems ATPase subunit